ncbi:sensor domain-containing protein [Noviherbaspirillum massiliense]|uniref:sensor domain-containing protein n=1 Tax=Noviherbaspirillum massiliense TaxID=1465823 RepID=UPI00036E9B1A|nr:bifunctional diguanylate cyclase/phosphodiesterase [Noviherbaspirillum massiliense]
MTRASGAETAREAVRHLADHASIIIWELDAEGRCIYLNPASMQDVPTPLAFDIADWFRFIHPEDFPEALRIFQDARAARKEYQVEYRVLRSDRSTRWFLGTGAPRLAADGSLAGYIGTIIDITERQQSRARLARSEAEHRLLTENAHDLISHSDADNRYLYASPSHKDVLGYEPQELIGTRILDYLHPEDVERIRTQHAGRERHSGLDNLRFRHKNGSWVWLGARTSTIRNPQTGERTGFVSVARDITAQLMAERELARREERFRSLTSLSSDWYWETDAELRFTFLSEGIRNRLGLNPQELLGLRFEATVTDREEPGFAACLDCMQNRQPFRDAIYPVELLTHPGIVRFLRVSGEPFSENGVFCGYRGITRDVTREVRQAKELERLATRDILTELPNRARLEARLKQRLNDRRGGVAQAVFFIDLDNFKEVNDSLGHPAGDALLKEIAGRLKRSVRPDDIVARLGGDEFVIVAECKYGSTSAARIAEKLCAAIEESVMLGGHEINPLASVGISLSPQDGDSCESLLQNADTALYRAKAAGGKTYRFYTLEMGAASRQRMMLQVALRHALERNEFTVHYQPRVDLATLEMTGMEALLRWTHPEMGAVSPAQFIPLAEESGLIEDIGEWVLQQASSQAWEWMVRYGRELRISVNLSARQLRSKKLVASVRQALQKSGMPARMLELELTETGLMEDPELAADLLKELKALGLHLSVDDFGTGYSSLAYLCRFPLDCLKLDRSFLLQLHPEDVSPLKLAEAIINLAHTLNLSVVAEGVETREHLDFLREARCDEIQGFCISKPLPAGEFETLLQGEARALPLRLSHEGA